MFKLTIAILLSSASFYGVADQYVDSYTRSNGTQVQGYYRSTPNSTPMDNYSHQGNTNPYTGERGTRQNENSAPSSYGNHSNNGNGGYYGYGTNGYNR